MCWKQDPGDTGYSLGSGWPGDAAGDPQIGAANKHTKLIGSWGKQLMSGLYMNLLP